MESYLYSSHYDLVSPDGYIISIEEESKSSKIIYIRIENISPNFIGFDLEERLVEFNLKSTLAQLGMDAERLEISVDRKHQVAEVKVRVLGISFLGIKTLNLLTPSCKVGKLFAKDPSRCIHNPDLITRMFTRSDRWGSPLLLLGGLHGSDQLVLEKIDNKVIAFLNLQPGIVQYDRDIISMLPTLIKSLSHKIPIREFIRLHQTLNPEYPGYVRPDDMLLVRTLPLHIRTFFARIADDLLPPGVKHTAANVLQPDTYASGDIYELHGNSTKEITCIPLEFYHLEPHREHSYFSDRDALQLILKDYKQLFSAFNTAPKPSNQHAAVFIVKGSQLHNLKEKDWITRTPNQHEFPGPSHEEKQSLIVERYIQQQAASPFLEAIENGLITSHGILLSRYLPTPMLKRMFLSNQIIKNLKGIYFKYPSLSNNQFFSQEDRSLLNDLSTFAIPVYWVDEVSQKILRYIQRPHMDAGMFVPCEKINDFIQATMFGVYGSNLIEGNFEAELTLLLQGILKMKNQYQHHLLNSSKPIGLITGGGPGAMAVGNRVAKTLNILSCANIVDFTNSSSLNINEQLQNEHVDIKMTYRLDKLIERQADFGLNFPIFLVGGIGSDFEFALEEVNRKVGATAPTPILLFGTKSYWLEKISSRFKCNLRYKTITGSEWISNCFYCIQNATQGLAIYRHFFENTLPIGPDYPHSEIGFINVEDSQLS